MYIYNIYELLSGCWKNRREKNFTGDCNCLKMMVDKKLITIERSGCLKDVVVYIEYCDTCGEVNDVRCEYVD